MRCAAVPALVILALAASPVSAQSCTDDNPLQAGTAARAIDAAGHYLFIADTPNNRVLAFALKPDNTAPGRTPDYALGQPDLNDCSPGTSRSAMNGPAALAVDSSNKRLFVADKKNNRVLVFDTANLSNGMNAAHVLGQANFTDHGAGATLAGMKSPSGLALDPGKNRLFVVDANNNTRVLVFDVSAVTDGMPALGVLGPPAAILKLPGGDASAPDALDTPRPVKSLPPGASDFF